MMVRTSVSCVSHSPNHAYMHEIKRTPPNLEKATSQKESTKSYTKALKSILLLREFAKEKNHQQKQKIHQSYKNASNQYFLRKEFGKEKATTV